MLSIVLFPFFGRHECHDEGHWGHDDHGHWGHHCR
jgi:hypothetical protein